MKKILIGTALAAGLVLAGCQASPPPASFLACMVGGASGFNDKSFNEVSHNGLIRAQEKLGAEIKAVSSPTAADYEKNIQAMVDARCNIVITVGSQFGDATEAAAKKNTGVQFAIVDTEFSAPPANLRSLLFKTQEPSFMAGYAAASVTKTGTVGTFGGRQVDAVASFMSGFVQGVAYYNEQNGADVKTVGWDVASHTGEFVAGDRPFGDVAGGKSITESLVAQGADVILPVAGTSGRGALDVAKASGGKVTAIWVDTDGAVSQEGAAPVILTSVVKAADVAVYEAIKSSKAGDFSNEAYVGTLANGGTYLSPFNDGLAGPGGVAMQSELERIKYDIMVGNITINL